MSQVQAFASIGDVMIGASQNLIAAGVWTALRTSLHVAVGHLTYFDKLSNLFMRLGTSWKLHKDYARLFPRCSSLQVYLCEYLISIVKLCTKIVKLGKKSFLGKFSFDTEEFLECEPLLPATAPEDLLPVPATVPNTPVTPSRTALPPPATPLGAFVRTSRTPLPMLSSVP